MYRIRTELVEVELMYSQASVTSKRKAKNPTRRVDATLPSHLSPRSGHPLSTFDAKENRNH